MKTVALLPMKAHSSRVPGKNFRDLNGKPLFRWILEELLKLDFVDQIVINTDAEQQLREAELVPSNSLIIKERPTALCGDEVSMNLILGDDIQTHPADFYLMTHTTNPHLSAGTLTKAWNSFQDQRKLGIDSMFSVNKHQTRFYLDDGTPVNHDPEHLLPTQELEPWYEENSCFYFFSPESFHATSARIGKRPTMYEIPKLESVDIDTWDDWRFAEAVFRMKDKTRV